MSNLIENNAYRILGLDTNASQKDILKRYKELINRLKIDDSPTYDLDIEFPQKLRTEESVNDAFKKLQNQKSNIKEYFFWFSISDKIDEKALNYLQNKDIEKAMQTWMTASKDTTSTAYFYKKNLAVLSCLMLFKKSNASSLKDTLDYWKEITNSDKFWAAFTKKYAVTNEQTISSDIISGFKKEVTKSISDVYTDLYNKYKDSSYVKVFQETFGTHGDKTEKKVLNPVYQAIYRDIEKLKKINVSASELEDEDAGYDNKEEKNQEDVVCDNCGVKDSGFFWNKFWLCEDGSTLCNKCKKNLNKICKRRPKELTQEDIISSINFNLDKLKKTGFYDDSQSKVVRDHVSEEIRNLSVKLHNAGDFEESIKLLNIAKQLCGTDSHKSKVHQDLNTVNQNYKDKKRYDSYQEIIDLIVADIEGGRSDDAFTKLDEYLSDSETDRELKNILKKMKKDLEERIAIHGKPIASAPSMSTIYGVGTKFYGDTQYFVFLFIPLFPIGRYSFERNFDDSYSFYGKFELHNWQKYWKYIAIGLIILWIIWIMIQS